MALVGSAGGLAAAATVLAGLPAAIGAPLIVLLHLDPNYVSHLAAILSRSTTLPVKQAESGDVLIDDHAFVAPPDCHLLVTRDGALELGHGPRVQRVRPSADVFLTSLALTFGQGTLAVILSGAGHDGAAGAAAVKLAGGVVIAQDEQTADYFGMPGAAIEEDAVDRVLPLEQLAGAIVQFVQA